jgi:hypothetical protein
MSDKRGHQNTNDTGSSAARARDDLRTATAKGKPRSHRNERRDQKSRRHKPGGKT